MTKGLNGQEGLKALLKEPIGHPLQFISPLGTQVRMDKMD